MLHTDPGDFGTVFNRGHVDFWANNRTELQPGCTFKQCGHGKAIYYYFASLFPQYKFIGRNCLALDMTCLTCINSDTSRFGLFNDGKIGQFFIDTTPCFPYAQTLELRSEQKPLIDEYKIRHDCKSDKSHKRCQHKY